MPDWSIILSLPTALILLIVSVNGWMIFSLVFKKPIPSLKVNWKDGTAEVGHVAPPAPGTDESSPSPPSPQPEAGASSPVEETKDNSDAETISLPPTFALEMKLYDAKEGGLFELEKAWKAAAADKMSLPQQDQQQVQVTYARLRAQLGFTDAIDEIATLTKNDPTLRRFSIFLAQHYFDTGDYQRSEEWADECIRRATLAKDHTSAYSIKLKLESRQRTAADLEKVAHDLLASAPAPESKADILYFLADTAFAAKDYEQSAILYQASFDASPNHSPDKFNPAHALSDVKSHQLYSYALYRRMEKETPRRHFVLNNLAFVCESLEELSLYGHYLERAIEVDKGWATGNVAIKLAEFGYLDSAQRLLDGLSEEERKSDRVVNAQEYFLRVRKRRKDGQEKLDRRSDKFIAFLSHAANIVLTGRNSTIQPSVWVEGSTTLTTNTSATDPSAIVAELAYNGVKCSGTLTRKKQHYIGTLKRPHDSLVAKKAFYVRVCTAAVGVAILIEELDYGEGKTIDSDLKLLSRSS